MRLLLIWSIMLLPVMALAGNTGILADDMPDQNSAVDWSDPTFPENAENHETSNERSITELWPYGNPYSPSSATNFRTLIGPPRSDPGGLTKTAYYTEWLDIPFGPYGSLYGPDPMNHRYEMVNLHSSDSPMIFYNLGRRIEPR